MLPPNGARGATAASRSVGAGARLPMVRKHVAAMAAAAHARVCLCVRARGGLMTKQAAIQAFDSRQNIWVLYVCRVSRVVKEGRGCPRDSCVKGGLKRNPSRGPPSVDMRRQNEPPCNGLQREPKPMTGTGRGRGARNKTNRIGCARGSVPYAGRGGEWGSMQFVCGCGGGAGAWEALRALS